MKASYCNTTAGMHELRHGSKSVASANCAGSNAFFAADSWHSCRTGAVAIALQHSTQLGVLCHLQGGLGGSSESRNGNVQGTVGLNYEELSMCSLAQRTIEGQGEGVLLRVVRHPSA